MISAGEASGDLHAASALHELSALQSDFTSFGMGSDKLSAAGTELLVDFGDLSVIGFVDVLLNYPRFMARLKLLRQAMIERKPDLLVLVDFPDFNFKLAETAKSQNIPILYYISPKFWAWRAGRLQRLKALVTHMAVIFPFEVDYFKRENIPVTYVGNPLVDSAKSPYSGAEARAYLGLQANTTTIGLLPGSRHSELQRNLPVMLEAASLLCRSDDKKIQFVLPRAKSLSAEAVETLTQQNSEVSLKIVDGEACNVMRACDAVICASGTATLETAMIGTPSVLVYRISAINYAIMSRLIRIRDIGLVNIVAGKRIVPELVQHKATAENIATAVELLINEPQHAENMRSELALVREKMGEAGASKRVAALIIQVAAMHKISSTSNQPA